MSTATTRLGVRCSTPVPVFDRLRRLLADDGGGMGDVTDALLGFVYDPPALDDFLAPLPGAELRADKRPRECVVDGEFRTGAILPAPPPELVTPFVSTPPPLPPEQQQQQRWQLPDAAFVRGAGAAEAKKGGAAGHDDDDDGRRHHHHHHHHNQAVQSAAARERRRRISNKTAELSRLIPGAARMNSTAEMLQAAARHVRLLQAQVGMLALMHSSGEAKLPSMAASQEHYQMRALLASGGVQERLADEGRCLVPTSLVHAIADDEAMANSNPALSRDLNRFKDSLEQQQ